MSAIDLSEHEDIQRFLQKNCEMDTEVKLYESYEENSEFFEPECERTTTKIIQKSKSFSNRSIVYDGDYKSNSLYQWLSTKKLEKCFDILYRNGFDDLESIFQQMRSDMPLNLDILNIIGIHKPGYRYRLLAWLTEDCQKDDFQLNPKPRSLSLCLNPVSTPGLNLTPSIDAWLESINLKILIKKFENSGFDDFESLVYLMRSKYPITDLMLEKEILIDKIGHRQRILTKLKEEAFIFKRRGLSAERENDGTACQSCVII